MSTPTNMFRCSIEIGPRDDSRFQRVVAGSENIYSVLLAHGRGAHNICVYGKADGEPILRRHTMAAFGLAADHDEQNLAQADMFLS